MASDNQNPLAPAIILFGSPGSGKGTQAKLLQQCLDGPHISTGDMLRAHITAGDEIGRQAEQLIRAGKLVPDELVNKLVEYRLQAPDARAGMILDGYPRTINQAEVLLGMLRRNGFRPAVVHLMVDCNRIVARLSGRRQCPVCGTLYSNKTHPPRVHGICDLDGAQLITREDDKESVIRERLQEYDRQTLPILAYFRTAGVPVLQVVGSSAMPEEIKGRIWEALSVAGFVGAGSEGFSEACSS